MSSAAREYETNGDDCRTCGGYGDDCPGCGGSGWVYTTTTACDHCGRGVPLAQGGRPIWNPGITGTVLCDDCEADDERRVAREARAREVGGE